MFKICFSNSIFSQCFFEGKRPFLEGIIFGIFMTLIVSRTVTQKFAYNRDSERKRLRNTELKYEPPFFAARKYDF